MKNKEYIKDPIHNNIEFNESELWIYELTQTREFKRLLSISQLGECSKVFVSSNNNRYSHSIGVYYLAKEYLNALNINDLKQRHVVLAAGLLHDIGHGPKSHSFEEYVGCKHEELTKRIILNKESDIYKILIKNNINPEEVISLISKSHKNKWMTTIISSQIDADRLDYLLRDSYYSGVACGKAVDYSFLFKQITIEDNMITYDSKTINLIETILFARYQMFQQLYLNKNIICYELLIINVFKRWKKLYEEGFKFKDKFKLYYLFNAFLEGTEWDLKTFLELDENKYNVILNSLWEEDDLIIKELLDSYYLENKYYVSSTPDINIKFEVNKYTTSKYFYDIEDPIYISSNSESPKCKLEDASEFIKTLSTKKPFFCFYLNKIKT